MDIWFFLMELVLLLGCAFLFGAIAEKFRQSPILGYILSGVVIGPVISGSAMVGQIAELGVSLLLFSIGLEFSFRQLRQLGAMAIGGGSLQVAGTLGIVTVALAAFISLPKALAVGAVIALSSTTLVLRVLTDTAAMDSLHGRAALSILLFQDIAIVPLVLMISLLSPVSQDIGIFMQLMKVLISVAGLVLVFYGLFYHVIPFLLSRGKMFANRELTVLLAISAGLGATWAAHAVGISPALGAFVAGMLLGESPFATQIRSDIGSLRTIMVTLFFASVGMLAKPVWFFFHIHWVLALALTIFVFKAGLIFTVARIFGLNRVQALATGIALGQIGEFSFVLATAARDGGILDTGTMDLVFSVIIVLMMATPYMVSLAKPAAEMLLPNGLTPPADGKREGGVSPVAGNRVLVVGFGPAGRHVALTLKARGLSPVVVDTNPKTGHQTAAEGLSFFPGDACREEVLAHAGLSTVCMAVITIPDPATTRQIIALIRALRPELTIAARCRYNRHLPQLLKAGADLAVDEETTVGEMLSQNIIERLDTCPGTCPAGRPEADTA